VISTARDEIQPPGLHADSGRSTQTPPPRLRHANLQRGRLASCCTDLLRAPKVSSALPYQTRVDLVLVLGDGLQIVPPFEVRDGDTPRLPPRSP